MALGIVTRMRHISDRPGGPRAESILRCDYQDRQGARRMGPRKVGLKEAVEALRIEDHDAERDGEMLCT